VSLISNNFACIITTYDKSKVSKVFGGYKTNQMNKNISLIFNSVLIVAVAILYYLHFTAKAGKMSEEHVSKDTAAAIKFILPQQLQSTNILYINADSLFDKYEYVKELKREAQSKQANLESRYTEKSQKFQQDYVEYQQKVSSGLINQEQAKAIEEDLMKRKNDIEQMEQQLNKLVEETQKKNALVQREISDFFKEYAKGKNLNYVLAYTSSAGSVLFANDSLDVTRQLVNALNAKYKAKQLKSNK
jgi:outer membrane protein